MTDDRWQIDSVLQQLGFQPIDDTDRKFVKIIKATQAFPMTFMEVPSVPPITIASDERGRVWAKVGTARGLRTHHFTEFLEEVRLRLKPKH